MSTAVEMGGRNTTNNSVTVTSQVGTGTLPQDYLSPSASKTMTTAIIDDGSKNVVATASPRGPEGPFSPVNVSADGSTPRDDASSSKEGSPTSSQSVTQTTSLRDDEELLNNVDDAKEESTTSSPSSTIKAEKVDLDLSIIGERVEIQNDAANDDVAAAKPTDEESDAVFDASNKDFIRIIHGDRQIMLIMPSEVSKYFVLPRWMFFVTKINCSIDCPNPFFYLTFIPYFLHYM